MLLKIISGDRIPSYNVNLALCASATINKVNKMSKINYNNIENFQLLAISILISLYLKFK